MMEMPQAISDFGPLAHTESWYWPINFQTLLLDPDEESGERLIGLKFEFRDGTETNFLMRVEMAATLVSGVSFEVAANLVSLKEEELGLEDDVE